jgi:hypothetical protein
MTPQEVFAPWAPAQRVVGRLAQGALPSAPVLRTTGCSRLGFDLQSEFATWLQCQTLFSADARRAAFCELVGAVTAYVVTGEKPALRADLPSAEFVAACVPAVALR